MAKNQSSSLNEDAVIMEPIQVDGGEEPTTNEATTEAPGELSKFGVWNAQVSKTTGSKILFYGTSGSGKTWAAATFPKPLFIDLEGGMRSIAHMNVMRLPKNPNRIVKDVKELKRYYDMISKMLAEGNAPFETIVIDSLNELQELVMRAVVENYSANRQYDDQPTLADYGKAMRDFMRVFNDFRKLPCNVIFTSVVAPKKYPEDQNSPSFVGQKTGPEVSRLVDAIGFTYTIQGTNADDIKYMVSFANTPDHVGKDRLGIGNKSKSNTYSSIFKELQ